MDYIRLRNLVFFTHHGLKPEEATLGQRFEVDIEIGGDLRSAGLSDNIAETIDFEQIYSIVSNVMYGPRRQLLESLAQGIADRIKDVYTNIQIKVIVRKPNTSLPGVHSGVEVEVNR